MNVTLLTFANDDAAGLVGILFILLLVVVGFLFYFLPTMIAAFRSHHQLAAIIVINLFFGWTFIGWIICLAWAVSATRSSGK